MAEEKKLTLSGKGKLTLKANVGAASHKKSNSIKVEVRKKRVVTGSKSVADTQMDSEKAAKLKLLQEAKHKEAQEAKERNKRELAQKEKEAQKDQEKKETRKETVSEQKTKDKKQEKTITKSTVQTSSEKEEGKVVNPNKEGGRDHKGSTKKDNETWEEEAKKKVSKKGGEDRRREAKISIYDINEDDEWQEQRHRSLASIKRARKKEKQKHQQQLSQGENVKREVVIPETITVQELANRMSAKSADVIKKLMGLGVMATINQPIDADTAQIVVEEMGHKFRRVADSDIEDQIKSVEDDEKDLVSRAPVVTIMGHVDHGKTSLLDALKETNIAEGEAGGITQHIGAYQIMVDGNKKITFIDTPGHAAFTEMRSRGAQVTDIVVLVVAANDGIMPQTIEAITHAKAAGVPIVVAINKMDVPGADPNRVKTELLSHELVVEEMGGEILCAEVSAKQRTNLNKLVEAIVLQSEILDLKANPNRKAEGVVVEAKMEKGRGSVATVLVQKGTLKIGDIFVTGKEWGRVRALLTEKGEHIKNAEPAVPAEVLGLQGTPSAGDDFIVVETEAKAREVAEYRQRKERQALSVKSAKTAMEQMFDKIKSGEVKSLPIIIKGDVQGSVEAIIGTLEKMANKEVKVSVLHSAVGGINESDITLAKASHALVLGFNVRANPQARAMAKREGIDIRYYSIIYDLADDIKLALEGMLTPELKENIIGYSEIRDVFNITKVGKVAGCMVTEGVVKRGAKVRLLRDNVVIHDGTLGQLKRFKDDQKEVKEGYECGMSFENYNDIQKGDFIECYEIEEIKVTLEDKEI